MRKFDAHQTAAPDFTRIRSRIPTTYPLLCFVASSSAAIEALTVDAARIAGAVVDVDAVLLERQEVTTSAATESRSRWHYLACRPRSSLVCTSKSRLQGTARRRRRICPRCRDTTTDRMADLKLRTDGWRNVETLCFLLPRRLRWKLAADAPDNDCPV